MAADKGTMVPVPIPFLRELLVRERLVVGTEPSRGARLIAEFDTAGAREALAPIAEECGWSLDGETLSERRARNAAAAADVARRKRELPEMLDSLFLGKGEIPICQEDGEAPCWSGYQHHGTPCQRNRLPPQSSLRG